MKQLSWTSALLPLLMASWFAQKNVLAESPPVFLRLKGVGVGSNVTGSATDVQVMENFAYLAWGMEWGGDTNHPGGMEIYSVTNPAAPVRVGGCESRAPANAIFVRGHYAYLAEGMVRTFTNDPGGLEVFDVSNPSNPVRVGGIDTAGRANAVRVDGDFAYVAESTRWTGSNLLGALEIIDISTRTNPVRAAIFDTAGSATSVDVSGSHAYLADGVTDLQVLDVSDPSNPSRIGVYKSDVSQNLCGWEPGGPADYVQVVGQLAYSAGDNGLHVLDISDPYHPVSIEDDFCNPVYGFRVFGRHAYAPVWVSYANTFYLFVLDTTDPTNLVTVSLKQGWGSAGFQEVGNLIYLAANPLSVYEISNRPMINSISRTDEKLILTWDFAPGFVLQRTASLANPQWNDVSGSEGQTGLQLPMTSGSEFFRLAKP